MAQEVHICCFCAVLDNNLLLLQKYMDLSHKKCNVADKYTIRRELEGKKHNITFNLFSSFNKNDTKTIHKADGVIILFDMSNRDEFEGILGNWLLNLRNLCSYMGQIIILGEDRKEDRIGSAATSFNINDDEMSDTISQSDFAIEFERLSSRDLKQIINSFIIRVKNKGEIDIENSTSTTKLEIDQSFKKKSMAEAPRSASERIIVEDKEDEDHSDEGKCKSLNQFKNCMFCVIY